MMMSVMVVVTSRLSFVQKVDETNIPRLSKAGWLRHQSMGPFLSGADGAVSNFNHNKVRFAVPY
jgi:hypothetical protein